MEDDKVPSGLKEILKNLVTINPYFRWTASECLAHPIFDDIREKDMELPSSRKIKLTVDQDGAFDYLNGVSQIKTEDLK